MDGYVDYFKNTEAPWSCWPKATAHKQVTDACKAKWWFLSWLCRWPRALLATDHIKKLEVIRISRARHGSRLENTGGELPRLHPDRQLRVTTFFQPDQPVPGLLTTSRLAQSTQRPTSAQPPPPRRKRGPQ